MNPRSAIPTRPGAVVVGGGIAGLVSAWELARAGVCPLLVEARGYLGGLIARGAVGGATVDLGAETYVVRGTDCTHVLGEAGVRRALKDQAMGADIGMDEAGETLAGFVTARMGEAVLERSVRPIIAGIYTADPALLATDTVAPGLRAETARHGSPASCPM